MTAAARNDDLPKIDKYDISCEIGHGGMATVYRAMDVRLGREVAVKIIHRHLRDNVEVAARFLAEARAAAKLKHRGIVEVYDVSSDEDRERYLVVELINGKTLRQTLLDDREMPPEVGAALVLELCEAVAHAHAASVIHRDIKPENVLIGFESLRQPTATVEEGDSAKDQDKPVDSGEAAKPSRGARSKRGEVIVKLTDFGIAKVLDAQGVTSTGQVLGSPAHMAPEQIEAGDVGVKTDVFALGVILYECMVGHLPFEGKNPAQVLRRVIEGEYAPADLERPGIGGVFASIIARALATDPADRIPTVDALAEALREELSELEVHDHRAELAAYFLDPDRYRQEHRPRVVQLLIARGERARKSGATQLAATHFNRAHALAPDDPAILRRISRLGASATRTRLLKRAFAAMVTAAVVASVTYVVVRELRAASQVPPPAGSASPERPVAEAVPSEFGPADNLPPRAISAPAVVRTAAIPRVAMSATTQLTRSRPVKFVLTPVNATLLVDGFPAVSGSEVMLSVGPHKYSLSAPKGDPCCEEDSGTLTIPEPPSDAPDSPYPLPMRAKLRKATVRLANAPAGGTALCGGIQITRAESSIEPQRHPWTVSCNFIAPGLADVKAVRTIHAGATQDIQWPAAP